MKKNKTHRDSKLLLTFFAILILVASYQFGYMTFKDKADKTNAENAANIDMLAELNNRTDNQDNYLDEIDKMKAKVNEISNNYIDTLTQEGITLFVIELEEHAGMLVDTVTFENVINVTSSTPSTQVTLDETLDDILEIDSETDDSGSVNLNYVSSGEVSLYSLGISISYKTDYDGLKKAIDYINQYEYRVNIRSLTSAYDNSTGGLTGTMVIDFYILPEYGEEYVPPVINVPLGVDNIFGTIDAPEILEENAVETGVDAVETGVNTVETEVNVVE